jgi:hypothetical protein
LWVKLWVGLINGEPDTDKQRLSISNCSSIFYSLYLCIEDPSSYFVFLFFSTLQPIP